MSTLTISRTLSPAIPPNFASRPKVEGDGTRTKKNDSAQEKAHGLQESSQKVQEEEGKLAELYRQTHATTESGKPDTGNRDTQASSDGRPATTAGATAVLNSGATASGNAHIAHIAHIAHNAAGAATALSHHSLSIANLNPSHLLALLKQH